MKKTVNTCSDGDKDLWIHLGKTNWKNNVTLKSMFYKLVYLLG